MRILVVEDELELRQAIARYLRGLGHAVDECENCRQATASIEIYDHDVVILDRMLPEGDSLPMLNRWREGGKQIPTIFLTARDSIEDRVDGLQAGADDYLVKPFAMEELVARITTISRRAFAIESPIIKIGTLEFDRGRREVRRNAVVIPLRPKEFVLLELLVTRKNRVVTKHQIVDCCWDEAKEPMSNVEESLVASLRRKLGEPNLIKTVRGSGYMIEEPNDA